MTGKWALVVEFARDCNITLTNWLKFGAAENRKGSQAPLELNYLKLQNKKHSKVKRG